MYLNKVIFFLATKWNDKKIFQQDDVVIVFIIQVKIMKCEKQ